MDGVHDFEYEFVSLRVMGAQLRIKYAHHGRKVAWTVNPEDIFVGTSDFVPNALARIMMETFELVRGIDINDKIWKQVSQVLEKTFSRYCCCCDDRHDESRKNEGNHIRRMASSVVPMIINRKSPCKGKQV